MTETTEAPAPVAVPDVLGVQGKARIVAQMLAPLQAERYEIHLVMKGNGSSEEDHAPGLRGEDGTVLTYGERLAQIGAMEASILDNTDPEVVEYLRTIKEQQS